MELNFKEIATVTMILFAVVDIVGSIPLVISIRQKAGSIQSEKASLVSLGIMIAFLFIGETILSLIGITVSDFAIAGSFILFFLALEMILGIPLYRNETPQTASVVPLAFPIIAGTGTLTTLLALRAQYTAQTIIIAIVINVIIVYAVLKNTRHLERLLGATGMAVLHKVFGIVLLAMAVKMFRTNTGI